LSASQLCLYLCRLLLILAVVVSSAPAQSQPGSQPDQPAVQTRSEKPDPSRARNEFGVWTGYSPFSFVLKGTSKDRELFLLNLQYAHTLLAARPIMLKYVAEAVPVALEVQPTQHYLVNGKVIPNPAGAIYGAGANPFGLQANLGGKNVQPFVNGTLGFLYFHDQVPIVGSSQFNYTITIGFGAQVYLHRRNSITFGWKYHHLSNDDQAHLNPGMDSGVFYVGWSTFLAKRR
jgi:hypothetical protein